MDDRAGGAVTTGEAPGWSSPGKVRSDRLTQALLDDPHVSRWARRLPDHLPPTYADSYGALQLGVPLLVPHDEMAAFADDLTSIFAAVTSLPGRCFDGDLLRYGRALGIDERLLGLVTLGASGAPPLYARADAFHDGGAFKLLELNVGSELGGADTAQLNRAYLRDESFRRFADAHHLGYIDTCEWLAATLRRAGEQVTSGDPVVALVEGRDGLAGHRHVFVALQEALREHGVSLLLAELDQLTSRSGKLAVDGTPVDVLLRFFAAEQLTDPVDREQLELVMAAHAAGRTALFTPLEGALFASKATLGLLHEPRVRALLSGPEREAVDRRVPWTRVLRGAVGPLAAAEREALIDQCRANRGSLVLKPGLAYGAVGVVLGREVSDQEWHRHLVEGGHRDYVVQELVVPAMEPVPNAQTGEHEDWRANWGVFVTDAGYSGAFVRSLRAVDGSVISYSNPGTRGTCVFTYPEGQSGNGVT